MSLDGRDLTDRLRPRLMSLTLTEKRGEEADQLDIVIDDSRGDMALPGTGAALQLALGWRQGTGVAIGLVDKGTFIVDEVEHSGPPDRIIVRARSADFTGAIRNRREQSWHETTLGTVLGEIAGRNGLSLRCAADLAAIAIGTLAQASESDVALIRRLGREHDAAATIKAGALIFSRIASGKAPSGADLPTLQLRRQDGDRHSFRVEKREEVTGVTAYWHDRNAARRESVTVGEKEGAKRLARTYPTEAAARRAVEAAQSHAGRQPRSLTLCLALGRADIYPEQRAQLTGFKAAIDANDWLVEEVMHTVGEGFDSRVRLYALAS